jgi:hypothetical protein
MRARLKELCEKWRAEAECARDSAGAALEEGEDTTFFMRSAKRHAFFQAWIDLDSVLFKYRHNRTAFPTAMQFLLLYDLGCLFEDLQIVLTDDAVSETPYSSKAFYLHGGASAVQEVVRAIDETIDALVS